MTVSVCTLAHGRDDHLRNLVRGLSASTRAPDELVIAVMQDEPYDLPSTDFPVRQIVMGSRDFSLAKARNTAAFAAESEFLVLLDVDCIPSPTLIADYLAVAASYDGVFMGEVGYLPQGATRAGIDFEKFKTVSVKHSERAGPPAGPVGPCRDYRCFWSLNFALRAETFANIGGFDTDYEGYGGEDTDFARMVVSAGMPLWWVKGAKAYHQQHAHHMPPVHHLDSVLANVAVFQRKWGEPTMQHWLRAFTLMGLVERSGEGWRKLREPGEAELALTRQQENAPYASSNDVLEWLEEREAERSANREAPSIAAE